MRLFVFWLITCILSLVIPSVTQAQSEAVAQVCAEIMGQYGIAPEGCDPHNEIPKESPIPDAQVTYIDVVSKTDLELEESNIFFRLGGAELDTLALDKLERLGQILNTKYMRDTCLRLVGHSDAVGAAEINYELGQRRANVVASFLRQRLSDPNRISDIRSAGEHNLIPSEPATSPRHRRVTIYVRKCTLP